MGARTALLSDEIAASRARRRGRRQQLLGIVLIGYGLVGIAIFVIAASAIDRPLERLRQLSESVEQQRGALVESMDQSADTLRQMATAVGRMDTSLSDAKLATDRASGIATGVASSMFQLRDAMGVEIPLIGQPLLGLAGSFDQAGQQLQLLSQDLAAIGASLDVNRGDVVNTAENLRELATSVDTLTDAVETGPGVEISAEALDSFRLAILAVAGWVVLFAIGCVLLGLYLLWSGRPSTRDEDLV